MFWYRDVCVPFGQYVLVPFGQYVLVLFGHRLVGTVWPICVGTDICWYRLANKSLCRLADMCWYRLANMFWYRYVCVPFGQ